MGNDTRKPFDVVDLFAGPGGWSVACNQLGLVELGLEIDDVRGLIASPPCQDFSTAGRMAGRTGLKGELVDVVPRWVAAVGPRWVACEQVPGVLPIWQEHALKYRELGYSTWTGILDASDFGVPQNRTRAYLLASLDKPALPPEPTHGLPSLLGDLTARVTLAEVLELGPGWVYDSGQNSQTAAGPVRYVRSCDRPSGTLTTKAVTQWVLRSPDGQRGKVSRSQALELQTFPASYPVQGSVEKQDQQIGNAVPPLMARRILEALEVCDGG